MSSSRSLIIVLGLLLTAILISHHALAQQDPLVLRLLVFRPDTKQAVSARAAGVDDAAVPALATAEGRSITGAFIGRRIDEALLAEIRDGLADYYGRIGRPFVDIAIPAQDVVKGTLRVNVLETTRGQVTVEGNRWFDARQYIDAIRIPSGGPIDIQSLTTDTEWLNRNDHRHVTISIRQTDDPAVYDLAIHAKDRLPLTLTLAADNTGTQDTGLYRTGIGLDWSNAFWRGDDFSYAFLTAPSGFRLKEHAVSYTTYLPWRDSITVAAVTADTRVSEPFGGGSTNGHTDIVSWRYAVALPSTAEFLQHIELGFDFKSTNTNILSGGITVFPSTSEVDQFSAGYIARRAYFLGVTGLAALLVASPGHLTPLNTEAAFAAQQPGASSSYVYGRIGIDRLTNLPFDTVWSARLTAQYSSVNLLSSEQLAFGGAQSIRGFADQGATRDAGVVMQHELRFAPEKPALLQGLPDSGPLVPFVFLDAGAGRNHLEMANVRRSWVEMVSTGPGLSWQFTPGASLRLSWGFPLVRNGHPGPLLGPQFGTQITF